MSQTTRLVWLREDLRLGDNPALSLGAQSGDPLICVYILEESPSLRPLGAATLWWLHHALAALSADIARLGGRLILRRGNPEAILPALVHAHAVTHVDWNRRYAPSAVAVDTRLKEALTQSGVKTTSHKANVLFEPWDITNKTDQPYKVFTPFWRAAMREFSPSAPLPAPMHLAPSPADVPSDSLDAWGLLPTNPNWANRFPDYWTPGEAAAHKALDVFCDHALAGYASGRDIPAGQTTSRLSPFLRWGEISPRQIFAQLTAMGDASTDLSKFKAELGWREFARSLHFHAQSLEDKNWKAEFDAFPWRTGDAAQADLIAWQKGNTGYPIIDAGMRELWATGWMHNRVRMVTASFLVKHLLIDWREGEKWFWDTLVDADAATNPASWQWVAGCGADAAPYFRIFNPYTQTERFDKKHTYIRKWAGGAPNTPIIDHAFARGRALEAYQNMRTHGKPIA